MSVPGPVQKGSTYGGGEGTSGEVGGLGGARHVASHEAQCGSLGCQIFDSLPR